MPARNKELDSHLGEIKDLYLQKGLYPREISHQFGCSIDSIRRRLKELGVFYNQVIPYTAYQESQMRALTDREKQIYLAAWIDTEGYIILKKYQTKKWGGIYRPEIGIRNTKAEPLNLLKEWFVGVLDRERNNHENHNDCYRLYFTQNKCRQLIPKILPFLTIKRQQAILLYEALKFLKQNKSLSGRNGEKSYLQLEQNTQSLVEISREISLLNHRGK